MKTIAQIRAKEKQIRQRIANEPMKENLWQDLIRKLEDWIGNVYDYNQSDRLQINALLYSLDNYASTRW